MIFQFGSDIVTHKPQANSNSDVEEIVGENDNLNERTPRQQKNKANTYEGPYKTPVILREKPWAPSVVQDGDNEADDSEIERHLIAIKERVSSGDSLNDVDDYVLCSIFRRNSVMGKYLSLLSSETESPDDVAHIDSPSPPEPPNPRARNVLQVIILAATTFRLSPIPPDQSLPL
jgi:hypothetical protein